MVTTKSFSLKTKHLRLGSSVCFPDLFCEFALVILDIFLQKNFLVSSLKKT